MQNRRTHQKSIFNRGRSITGGNLINTKQTIFNSNVKQVAKMSIKLKRINQSIHQRKSECKFIKDNIKKMNKQLVKININEQNRTLLEKESIEQLIQKDDLEQGIQSYLVYKILNTEKKDRSKLMIEFLYNRLVELRIFDDFRKVQGKYNMLSMINCLQYYSLDQFKYIYDYQDVEDFFYFVIDGEVSIKKPLFDENGIFLRYEEVNIVKKGQSFGEIQNFQTQIKRGFSSQCLSNCHLAFISKDDYKKYCEQFFDRLLSRQLNMLNNYEVLRDIQFFYLRVINQNMTEYNYKHNQAVFKEGEPLNYIYMVKEGEFLITKSNKTQRNKLPIFFKNPNQKQDQNQITIISSKELLDDYDYTENNETRNFNCYCYSNTATLIAIDFEIFISILEKHPPNLEFFRESSICKLERYMKRAQGINIIEQKQNSPVQDRQKNKQRNLMNYKYLQNSVPEILTMNRRQSSHISSQNQNYTNKNQIVANSPISNKIKNINNSPSVNNNSGVHNNKVGVRYTLNNRMANDSMTQSDRNRQQRNPVSSQERRVFTNESLDNDYRVIFIKRIYDMYIEKQKNNAQKTYKMINDFQNEKMKRAIQMTRNRSQQIRQVKTEQDHDQEQNRQQIGRYLSKLFKPQGVQEYQINKLIK